MKKTLAEMQEQSITALKLHQATPSPRGLEDKYASPTPPLSLRNYELEFLVKKHKDLKRTRVKYRPSNEANRQISRREHHHVVAWLGCGEGAQAC